MKIQKRKSHRALIVTLVVVFVLAGGTAFYYFYLNHGTPLNREQTNQSTTNGNAKTDAPSDSNTTTETKPAPDDTTTTDETKPSDTVAKKSASIVIADATQYGQIVEVRAFINNVAENGGSCIISLTQGDQTVSRTVVATFSGTTTTCPTTDIPISEFPGTGAWQLTIQYDSPQAAGTSEVKIVNIK